MLIAQISDTHILPKLSDEAAAISRADNLRQCIADINRQGVDVVIHTGDSVQNGTAEEYAYLREILDQLEAPLFLVPGNRDRRDALRTAFADLSYMAGTGDFVNYAVEDYRVRLIGLDTVETGERKGFFGESRRAWLEETLASEPDRPTVLFFHHPPFDVPSMDYVGGYRHPEDATNFAALVTRHRAVVRIMCGHVHCLHGEQWGGTTASSMPSVAVDVRKGVDEAVGAAPLYVLHNYSPEEGLVTRTQVVSH